MPSRLNLGSEGPEKYMEVVKLVDYALKNDTGKLFLSERPAEQEGIHMLFRGTARFVRNPPSHKKLKYSELEARQTVGLIDYLLSLLGQTKKTFEITSATYGTIPERRYDLTKELNNMIHNNRLDTVASNDIAGDHRRRCYGENGINK